MSIVRATPEADVLFAIDLQDPFCDHLVESDRLLRRAEFLLKVAKVLGVPTIATEQVPSRLGPTHPRLSGLIESTFPKDSFSCLGDPDVQAAWQALARPTAVLIGAETHICVSQTALDLLDQGVQVLIGEDATSARHPEAHRLGMARATTAGAIPIHSEALVYEWMKTSKNPGFRQVLGLVKEYAL
jgi:nicotinamidase-related amidase